MCIEAFKNKWGVIRYRYIYREREEEVLIDDWVTPLFIYRGIVICIKLAEYLKN